MPKVGSKPMSRISFFIPRRLRIRKWSPGYWQWYYDGSNFPSLLLLALPTQWLQWQWRSYAGVLALTEAFLFL
ncbi:hypothetical protein GCM10027567_12500 [Spongiibacter taiwanensis]